MFAARTFFSKLDRMTDKGGPKGWTGKLFALRAVCAGREAKSFALLDVLDATQCMAVK